MSNKLKKNVEKCYDSAPVMFEKLNGLQKNFERFFDAKL